MSAAPPVRLDARARATLRAVCARVIGSEDEAARARDVVEARLATEPAVLRDVALALRVLDHPAAGLLFHGRPRRFCALAPAEQEARLRRWGSSRIALRRAVVEALRRIVLSTWYAQPDIAASIGHRGPLHRRSPLFAWEGAAPGEPRADEPIARGAGQPPVRAPLPAGVTEGGTLPATTALRTDVCVIGSGAGGAVVAARLAEAGRDVIVLEEGGYFTPDRFTENEAEMIPRLYADAGMRATTDLGVSLLQGRCVGGGTTVNWLIMLRPPLRVMQEWADVYAAELLGPAMLVPALERIEAEVHARMVPDDAHSPANRIILDGSAALGWRAGPARINADGCVRAGTCGLGCRYRAKQSALESWLPRALRSGARLFSDVRVERLRRLRDGPAPTTRVDAVVLDRDTRAPRGRLTVDARTVVLAAGAVGTPVILQRSGLGGGVVGQYLRLHPTTGVLGAYPRAMYAAAGIPQSAVCTEGIDRGDGFGFWIECPPLLPGVSAAALPGFGPAHAARMADFERTGPLIVLVRDGAEPRRSQGRVRARRGGGARIDYRLGAAERRTLAEAIHSAVRLHFAAGADAVLTLHAGGREIRAHDDFDWILRATGPVHRLGLLSAHINGTCRMGTDPRTSGCSPTGQRHGAPGIVIADGSIFPSAPSANPQATIMAAASLIAEML